MTFLPTAHSQMSNLMNQARLKVLKARDDMITVSGHAVSPIDSNTIKIFKHPLTLHRNICEPFLPQNSIALYFI